MTQSHTCSACDYCGLPVTVRPTSQADAEATDPTVYCCLGCRFAAAVAQEKGAEGQARWTLTRLGLAIFFTMNVMVFTMALWTWDVYQIEASHEGADQLKQLFRYACLLFASPVLLLLGMPLAESAWDSLRRGVLTTDILLITGVLAAFCYSLVSLWRGQPHVYFEVSCMVLVAVTLGRWLEATGKIKTTDALQALQQLLPAEARCVDADQRTETTIPLAEIQPTMLLHVLAGERVPTDGRLVHQAALLDEQLITGESRPVAKAPGEAIYGGSLCCDRDLYFTATSTPSAGTLQRIVDEVRRAAQTKSAHVRFADRCVQVFTPLLMTLTVATFLWHTWRTSFDHGLMTALAVLLIACPCALGIATPLALWAGLGRASRGQVLFRDGDTLTALTNVRTICLDKTGTLSTGALALLDERWAADVDVARARDYTRAVAACSIHPLSRAIVACLPPAHSSAASSSVTVGPTEQVLGRGVCAEINELGEKLYLGNLAWMRQAGCQFPADWPEPRETDSGRGAETQVWVGWQGRIRGVFRFLEEQRAGARAALQHLRDLGLDVVVLTGDTPARGAALAEAWGITVHAGLLPTDKQAYVRALQARQGSVAMVGDGVNDAPALAEASVGIALGCGADASRDAAGVCLLGNDLERLAWTVQLARSTTRTIRQNLAWAFGYNLVGVSLAVVGWLNPIIAAAAMVGSSLWVIGNSLRLTAFPEPNPQPISPQPTSAQPISMGPVATDRAADDRAAPGGRGPAGPGGTLDAAHRPGSAPNSRPDDLDMPGLREALS